MGVGKKLNIFIKQKCDDLQDYYICLKSVFQKLSKKLRIFINKMGVGKKLSIFINKSAMAHKIIILARSLFFKNMSKKLTTPIPQEQKCDGSQEYYFGSKFVFQKHVQKVKHLHKCDGSKDYYICSKSVYQKYFQKVKNLHKQKCDGSQDYCIGSKSVFQKHFKKS